MKCIEYKGRYKYQLKKTYIDDISIRPPTDLTLEYITLSTTGQLSVKCGYAWDGPSGWTIDTPCFMRGSLVHDALYQLMRDHDDFDAWIYREPADRLLQTHCKEDGMWSLWAWIVYQAVRFGGGPSADPCSKRPIKYAPKSCPIDQ